MATYSNLESRVARLLNDEEMARVSAEMVYDGILSGHDAILPWVPKTALVTLTSGSNGFLFALPADCYSVQSVLIVETNVFVPKATLSPRSSWTQGIQTDNNWIDYPMGYLTFSEEIEEGETIQVFYHAFWTKPSSPPAAAFVIEVPTYAHQGMVYYAASQVMMQQATGSGGIRQFNTRVDSGTPEDNPLLVLSQRFLERFYQEMKMMPPYTKVGQ